MNIRIRKEGDESFVSNVNSLRLGEGSFTRNLWGSWSLELTAERPETLIPRSAARKARVALRIGDRGERIGD